MAAELNTRCSTHTKSVIPRSRSDFNYVNLTPKEKRRTTDFSHLLPHFSKDPPYSRLLDSNVPIVEQPKTSNPVPPQPSTRMCRSATGALVKKSPTLEVIRSHSMRSLRRSLEMSPTKLKIDDPKDDVASVCSDINRTPNLPEDKDYRRLRNFSVTPKGVVNWGDSFRSISMPFVPGESEPSSTDLHMTPSSSGFDTGQATTMSNITSSASFSYGNRQPQRYRIVILGSSNVGKTTMIKQFKTSEYICAYDSSCNDENTDFAITVILNGEESELEFVDSCSLEEETDDEGCERGLHAKPYIASADGYLVVYSVTSRRSYLHGLRLVSRVQNSFLHSPVLLVGNKSDLVRIRAVTTDEASNSAKELNCEFMETSVAINHQVDELLVAILTAMRTKHQCVMASANKYSSTQCSLSKAKGIIKNFLKKACFQSKSCDNLQRL